MPEQSLDYANDNHRPRARGPLFTILSLLLAVSGILAVVLPGARASVLNVVGRRMLYCIAASLALSVFGIVWSRGTASGIAVVAAVLNVILLVIWLASGGIFYFVTGP